MPTTEQLMDPNNWFDCPTTTGVVLLDPSTGERFPHQSVPDLVQTEPEFVEAIEFGRRYGGSLHATILYGPHHTALDLGDPKEGWHERQLARVDYYGHEDLGGNAAEWVSIADAMDDAFRMIGPEAAASFATFCEALGIQDPDFIERKLWSMAQSSTPAISADLQSDGTWLERTLLQAREAWLAGRPGLERAAGYMGLMHAREWVQGIRLLRGVQLGEQAKGTPGRPDRQIEIYMNDGARHRHLTKKLGVLGVGRVTERFADGAGNIRRLDPHRKGTRRYKRAFETGFVATQDLAYVDATLDIL